MHKIDKLLKPNYGEFKIIRELNNKEVKQIEQEFYISNLVKFKKKLKLFLIKIIKVSRLTNIIKISNPRSLGTVHSKYERIAGDYIKNHNSKKKLKFIAINENKKVFECRGMITPYYGECLKNIYKHFGCKSILEVGAGELTTIFTFINRLIKKPKLIGAIDISHKRLSVGKDFLKLKRVKLDYLARADASKLPFNDNTFDMVYTANCLEQVPDLFLKSLKELVRVSTNLIVIIEPSYQFGNLATKNSIIKKGYTIIKDQHFKKLGLKPIYRNALKFSYFNVRAEITILQKKKILKKKSSNKISYICPNSRETLFKMGNFLSNKDKSISYKIKNSIPLLCESDKL